MEAFANSYHHRFPGLFLHKDTPFILAFSVVMLQTDLHNKANLKRMSKEEFIRNNRGIDDGEDLPREFLSDIYDRIKDKVCGFLCVCMCVCVCVCVCVCCIVFCM